jgi:hypothetical protein
MKTYNLHEAYDYRSRSPTGLTFDRMFCRFIMEMCTYTVVVCAYWSDLHALL